MPGWWKDGQRFRRLNAVAPLRLWWNEWHEKFKAGYESNESKTWYSDKYRSTVLNRLDPTNILAEINKMAGNMNAYLLCYETPEKFCHRHLLAEWLNLNAGLNITEWIKDEDKN